ncbi:PAS domain-containing protein [Salinimicrobium soli]
MKKNMQEVLHSQDPYLFMARSITQTAQEPVLVLNSDLTVMAASEAFCSCFDCEDSEVAGMAFSEWEREEFLSDQIYKTLKSFRRGEIKKVVSYTTQKGDFQRQFSVNLGAIPAGEEDQLLLISFREQKREKTMEEANEQKSLQEVLEHAPALICILRGPNHIFEAANENYLQLVNNRDIIGRSVKEALPEVVSQGFIKILDQVYGSGEPFIGSEIGVKMDSGSGTRQHYMDFVYQPMRTAGRVDGIFVHAVDVTEKVEFRQKLIQGRDELQNIIDTIPAIIWITDKEGKSISLNRNWEEYTGQSVSKALNMGWLEQVHPEDRQRVGEHFLECNREQKTYSVSLRLHTKDGGYRWVMDKGAPKYDSNGNFEGFIGTVVDVHDDKMKEQLVREKEHKMGSIVEQATVATAIYTGREMRIEMANDAMIRLWGKDRSVVGQTLRKALPELEGQPFHDLLDKVYTTGKTYWGREDKVDLLIDGKIQTGYFNFTYKALRNEQGEIYGILNMALDVTEQVLIRKEIQESEKRYQDIILSSPYPIATFKGEDFIIEIANDAMIESWGKGKNVFGKPLLSVFPELVEQDFDKILSDVYTTGKPFKGYEMPVSLFRNGKREELYYNFVYYPQRDLYGKIVGIVDIAIEATPQAELKKKLEQSEFHYRQMADLMLEKVINTDPQGAPIYFNQNWLDYTGMSSEELKEDDWTSFIHPEDITQFREQWQSSLTTGSKLETEIRIADKDHNYAWHLSRAEAVKDDQGNIKMWIGTNTEIQRLKEEEKRKGDFLKMVSHELKTPVTSIKGYVQLLLKVLENLQSTELDKMPFKPSLQRIDHQIVRLTRLISEMLDLSRIEEGKLELQKEKFHLNQLVDDTVQDISLTNTEHNIQVKHDLNCEVVADKDRIGQVLINFITNAIKYSPVNQEIIVSVVTAGEAAVAVQVKDKGLGIDPKDQEKIFKRFYRVGGENEETYSGFGIGLYLAKEIIQRHNGKIEVNSERGKGSEFSFILSTV